MGEAIPERLNIGASVYIKSIKHMKRQLHEQTCCVYDSYRQGKHCVYLLLGVRERMAILTDPYQLLCVCVCVCVCVYVRQHGPCKQQRNV